LTLIKTSILSALSTIIRIISGFIVTKIIAVYVGPSGLAVVGQLQNFINIMLMFAGGFLRTGITKYTSEYNDNESKKYNIWSASTKIIFILNIIIFTILFFFSNEISLYLLKTDKYEYVLNVLAISLPFFVLNTMLLSILNGQRQIKKYISLNISLSLISLLLVSILSINYGLKGALIAYTINQSFVFFITLFFIRNEYWFNIKFFLQPSSYKDIKRLLGFAMITLSAVLSSNISLIIIRDFISETVSLESAGYWQAIWSLSQIAMTLITTSLVTYFLPTISAIKINNELSKEVQKVLLFIVPITILISFSIFILRDFIITILYTKEFLPMRELFLWQMVGNIITVIGWVFGYVLVSKAMVKYTVSIEIIFAISFVGLSLWLVNCYGVIGMTYSYIINSFLYTLCVIYIYKYKILKVKDV
jgi:PST family polysaccharide transporter